MNSYARTKDKRKDLALMPFKSLQLELVYSVLASYSSIVPVLYSNSTVLFLHMLYSICERSNSFCSVFYSAQDKKEIDSLFAR